MNAVHPAQGAAARAVHDAAFRGRAGDGAAKHRRHDHLLSRRPPVLIRARNVPFRIDERIDARTAARRSSTRRAGARRSAVRDRRRRRGRRSPCRTPDLNPAHEQRAAIAERVAPGLPRRLLQPRSGRSSASTNAPSRVWSALMCSDASRTTFDLLADGAALIGVRPTARDQVERRRDDAEQAEIDGSRRRSPDCAPARRRHHVGEPRRLAELPQPGISRHERGRGVIVDGVPQFGTASRRRLPGVDPLARSPRSGDGGGSIAGWTSTACESAGQRRLLPRPGR